MKRVIATCLTAALLHLSAVASPAEQSSADAEKSLDAGSEELLPPAELPPLMESSMLQLTFGYRSPADTLKPWISLPYGELSGGPVIAVKGSRAGESGILDLSIGYLSDHDYLLTLSADRVARYRLAATLESFRFTRSPLAPHWSPFTLDTTTYAPFDRYDRVKAETTIRQNEVMSRIKPFDYPFHLDLSARTYEKSGASQLRYADVLFTGEPNTIGSVRRDLDRRVSEFGAGFDAHLGYVDLVNSFRFMMFRDEKDTPRDPFVARSRNGSPWRTAALLQHNEDPEGRFWMNTTRLHTSLSGGLVGALSWSFGKRQSESNITDVVIPTLPETTVNNLTADISWQPFPASHFAVTYRREEVDTTLPAVVTRIGGAADTTNGDQVVTPPPVDYVRETLIGGILWHVLPRTTFKTEYRGEFTRREGGQNGSTASWIEAYASTRLHREEKHRWSVSLQARPLPPLRLRGEYSMTGVTSPFYATTPDRKLESIASVGYDPDPRVAFLLDYRRARESADAGGGHDRRGFEREFDTVDATATLSPHETLTLTASLSYHRDRVDGPLAASIGGGNALSFATTHSQIARVYALRGGWRFTPAATMSVGYSRTIGDLSFGTDTVTATIFGSPASSEGVGTLALKRLVDHEFSTNLDVQVNETVSWNVAWLFARSIDRLDPSHEGYAHLLSAMVSCRW